MAIELTCGYSVDLAAFHTEFTYAGFGILAGIPTPDMNAQVLGIAPRRMVPVWGERTTHIIPPLVGKYEGHDVFPVIMNFALLKANPIKPGFDESELVVGWFEDNQQEEFLIKIVSQAIRDIPWASLAMDYNF